MALEAIAALSGVSGMSSASGLAGASGLGPAAGLSGPSAAAAPGATSGTDFAGVLGQGFDAVQATQSRADSLAVQAATGTLTDPSQLTIAATQASLMTSLATTIESKAVQAFNQIMSMQA
ncbi:MAG: flagellar hook-basal body complex protein FliE [Jatrophihabitans sp.]|uniref:flagellar hook-basal body complex protein FliE n=1 Tax=Jatrophihabitans sp. TaxID=1932789 RepID=UPI003F7E813B